MSSDDKKERVLHTRVSLSLDEEIRDRANKLGVSVSNLVRNVLHNAFEMVEDIVTDGNRVAQAAQGRKTSADVAASATAARPVGWQPLVLNVNAVCADCNAILARGTNAAMAIFRGSGPDTFLCQACLESLDNERESADE